MAHYASRLAHGASLAGLVGAAACAWTLLGACSSDEFGTPDDTPVVLEAGAPFELPARSYWPSEAWRSAGEDAGRVDEAALAKLDAYAFRRTGDEQDRRGQRTNALLIVKDGVIVYERYARGYDRDSRLLTWSVSKSLANTLIGVAVAEGKLDLNAPAAQYYEPLARDGLAAIRITDLLRMSSGIDWHESYEGAPFFSSVIAMLYGRGRRDMPAFVASHDMAHAPGSRWLYSSGDTNLLMAALKSTMSESEYALYPWRALFERIGMRSVVWERDGRGTFVGSSYLYATARDLARWALLMMHDGVWNGERLLPEGWLRYSLTPAPGFVRNARGVSESVPGAQLYTNRALGEREVPAPWPSLPADAFGASGHWGKLVTVVPSLDLIAVRMGDDREYGCAPVLREEGCVDNPEDAFTLHHFHELLMDVVTP
ncbi:serine hydrolase domain-containing protein [Haliangium ochraceum]|nr:serine hydrolase [Haliangium ochraceum]